MPDSIFEQQILPRPEEPKKRRLVRVLWWGMMSAILAFVVIGVTAVLYIVILVRETQVDNRKTNLTIEDCTSTTGECFQRNQESTAKIVGGINDWALLAAACADQPQAQTVSQIEECILDKLAERTKNDQ